MITSKQPKCKNCGSSHYTFSCPNSRRKPLKAHKPLQARKTPFKAKKPISTTKTRKPLKRSQMKPKSDSIRSALTLRADKIFSTYIRLRDSTNGRVRCATCGYADNWKYLHCGHYISRRFLNTRWYEFNAHPQCPKCNTTLHGNLAQYKQYLMRRYGTDIIKDLTIRANNKHKVTIIEIRDIIELYTNKIKELQKRP